MLQEILKFFLQRSVNQGGEMIKDFNQQIEDARTDLHTHVYGKPPEIRKKEEKKLETPDEYFHRMTNNKFKK